MSKFEQLVKLLNSGSDPKSAEVEALLKAIEQEEPELSGPAQIMVDNWVPKKPVITPGQTGLIATVVGGGGSIAVLSQVQPVMHWLETNMPLPNVTTPLILLPIIALIGAISGACYSIYRNRGIVKPEFSQKQDVLTLTRFGILNEIGYGAAAAVTTVWLAAVGLNVNDNDKPTLPVAAVSPAEAASKSDGDSASKANPGAVLPANPAGTAVLKKPVAPSLLTYSMVLGAVVSGWLGATMRVGFLDQKLLQQALADSSRQQATGPSVEQKIRHAPSAAAAACIATGKNVVGTNPVLLQEAMKSP